jgi:hypothetical protein
MFLWVTIFVGKVMFAFFLIHRRADISCLSFKGFLFIDLLQKVFFLFIEIAGEDEGGTKVPFLFIYVIHPIHVCMNNMYDKTDME